MFCKSNSYILIVCIYFFLFEIFACDDLVQMRIVDEVSSYGWNANADRSRHLEPKIPPNKFSGPDYFKSLQNKCFTLLKSDYKYELCLFNNATQHERTMRWNPYSGILGTWTEWKIENYTFVAMMMKNGEDCGNQNRQVEVNLACGRTNNLTNVSEPIQCHYKMTFETPLACHEDALLVYPIMNETLRKEWDELEQNFYGDIITKTGYKHYLSNIFFKAGFISEPLVQKPAKTFEGFRSLDTCNIKYEELLKENESLKKRLEKN